MLYQKVCRITSQTLIQNMRSFCGSLVYNALPKILREHNSLQIRSTMKLAVVGLVVCDHVTFTCLKAGLYFMQKRSQFHDVNRPISLSTLLKSDWILQSQYIVCEVIKVCNAKCALKNQSTSCLNSAVQNVLFA